MTSNRRDILKTTGGALAVGAGGIGSAQARERVEPGTDALQEGPENTDADVALPENFSRTVTVY
jgi:hypothetical protein